MSIVIVGEPKEAQQHSHSREKVLGDSLLQAKRVLSDCRGFESALEAVRLSVEAVRVSKEALRCLRILEHITVLVLFQSF